MYSVPSTSNRCEPCPRAMKTGCPPTLRKARTGEFTPPGIFSTARRNNSSDFVWVISMSKRRPLSGLGNYAAEAETHRDLVQAPVEIAQQAALESQVGLLAGEQILHHVGEARTAARELHHSLRHGAEHKASHEHSLGEPRAEFQVGRKIASHKPPVLHRVLLL